MKHGAMNAQGPHEGDLPNLIVGTDGRGTVGEMNRAVVSIFEKWGFAWGGDWRYTDPMHFELSEIKRVG